MDILISLLMSFSENIEAGIDGFLKGWHWFEKLLLLTFVLLLAVFVCVFLVLRP